MRGGDRGEGPEDGWSFASARCCKSWKAKKKRGVLVSDLLSTVVLKSNLMLVLLKFMRQSVFLKGEELFYGAWRASKKRCTRMSYVSISKNDVTVDLLEFMRQLNGFSSRMESSLLL